MDIKKAAVFIVEKCLTKIVFMWIMLFQELSYIMMSLGI